MVWLCFSAPEHHPRWLWWLPLRGAGCPALSSALPPQFNGLVTAELLAPFEQWRSLIPQPLAARHLRFLLRAIPDHRFEVQHLASITQPGLGRAGRDSLPGSLSAWYPHASARLRRPTALAGHVIGPALTAAQQVVALGNQAPLLVQVYARKGLMMARSRSRSAAFNPMFAIADVLETDHGYSNEQSDAWLEHMGPWG